MDIDLKNMTNDEIRDWVLKTLGEAWALEPEKRAEVAKHVMENLNKEVDPVLVEFILQTRGRGCYDRHREGMLGEIPESVRSIEDFIDYLDKRWSSFPGGITDGLKRKNNVLTARLYKCPCDFVNKSKEIIPKSYCNCSAGFYRSIFEEFLGREVKAEVVSSIASGSEKCEIKIILPKDALK